MKIKYKLESLLWWSEFIVSNMKIIKCKGKFNSNDFLNEDIQSVLDRIKCWGYEFTTTYEILDANEIVILFEWCGKLFPITNRICQYGIQNCLDCEDHRNWSEHPFNRGNYFDWYSKEDYEQKIKMFDEIEKKKKQLQGKEPRKIYPVKQTNISFKLII